MKKNKNISDSKIYYSIEKCDNVDNKVLDEARKTLQSQRKETSDEKIALNKRNKKFIVTLASLACAIICICIVVPISINNQQVVVDNVIPISSLQKEEIASIKKYNTDNGTNFLNFVNNNIEAYKYRKGESDILLKQIAMFESVYCEMFVLLDVEYNLDILQEYEALSNEKQITHVLLYYQSKNENTLGAFSYEEKIYYFKVKTNDFDTFEKIISSLF